MIKKKLNLPYFISKQEITPNKIFRTLNYITNYVVRKNGPVTSLTSLV